MDIRSLLQLLPGYLRYIIEAVDDHSLHSPFMFDLYQAVFKNGLKQRVPQAIKKIRIECLENDMKLDTKNPGAGSRKAGALRRVRDLAEISSSAEKTCRVLSALVLHYKPACIVELGTSIGLGTLCMAVRPESRIFTFEANEAVSGLAEANFKKAGFENIALIRGDIDQTLPDFAKVHHNVDMVFIDANHTEKALLRYFEILLPIMNPSGFIVVDDIRWSPGMYRGWLKLVEKEMVTVSVDLMRQGLLFFNPNFFKTHYYLEY